MAQWAKRPPLKLEVPGSNPRGCFNGRAGNRGLFRWLETARGLSTIRLIGRAQYSPGGLAASSLKRVSISHPFAVSAKKNSVFVTFQNFEVVSKRSYAYIEMIKTLQTTGGGYFVRVA